VLLAVKRSGFKVPVTLSPGFIGKVSHDSVQIESSGDFEQRVVNKLILGLRIWQLGSNEGWSSKARTKPDIHIITGEVLVSGGLVGLNLVREQAVSITQHPFGELQERTLAKPRRPYLGGGFEVA
jgi:hypothetical protein